MKKLLATLAMTLLLVSCQQEESNPPLAESSPMGETATATQAQYPGTASPEVAQPLEELNNHIFEYNGVSVPLGGHFAPIYEALGAESDYFEAPSCAFDGLDKIYYYNALEIHTYPQGEEDFVSAVILKDDSITTPEGAYIGMASNEAVIELGYTYEDLGNQYIYTQGDSTLTVILEEKVVIALIYRLDGTEGEG